MARQGFYNQRLLFGAVGGNYITWSGNSNFV
jgi:hypothetical protein